MSRVCFLKHSDFQACNNGEHTCPNAQMLCSLSHSSGCRRRFHCENKHVNTGQKMLCPDFCMNAVGVRKHVAAHRLMLRNEYMRCGDRTGGCHSRDDCLRHRPAADDSNAQVVTHDIYRFSHDISSVRRCSSSE